MRRLLTILLVCGSVISTMVAYSAKDESDDNKGTGSVRVTQPNGGQKWKTGKSYALKWTHKNAGTHVKIQLLKSNKHYKWVTKKTKNDGKHPWKIPSTVATGKAYKVKITSRTKKTVTDTSNLNFTITKVGGDIDDSTSLEMISPNGRERWKKGTVVSIEWEDGSLGGRVSLTLYKSGKRYLVISSSTPNDGLRRWSIPKNLATSSAYKIKVQSKTKASKYDYSDRNFTVYGGDTDTDNST